MADGESPYVTAAKRGVEKHRRELASMATVKPDRDLDSIESDWLPLAKLAKLKQYAVAEEIGIDASQLSDFVNGKGGLKISAVRKFLAAVGCKVVSTQVKCMTPEMFESLTKLSGNALLKAPELIWDDGSI